MVSRNNLLALLGVGVSAFVLSASGVLAAEDAHIKRLAKAASASTVPGDDAELVTERARRIAAEKMVAELQSRTTAADGELIRAQQQLAGATAGKNKVGASEDEIKRYQDEITKLDAQIAQMESSRAQTNKQIAELQAQLSRIGNTNEIRQQVDIERARREASERAMAELQSSSQGRDQEVARLQQQLATVKATPANDPQAAVEKARRQATENELQKAKSVAGAADAEAIRLAKANAAMQQQMTQLQAAASNDKVAQMSAQLATLEQRNSELMAQLQAAKTQNEAAAQASVMTTSNDAATNQKIAELGRKAAADQAETLALLEAEKSRRQKLEALLAQGGSETGSKAEELARHVADLSLRNAQLEKRLSSEQASLPASTDAQVAQLQKQLSSMKSDNAMLAEKLAVQSMSAGTGAQGADAERLQKQVSVLKSDNEMLAQKLASKATPAAAPVTATATVYSGDDQIASALAETKSSLASVTAERDEYRNLLQRERLSPKDTGKAATPTEDGTNARIAALEAERVDLARKLEFERSKNEAAGIPSGGEPTGVLKELQDKLADLQSEKSKLEKQLKVTQQDVIDARIKAQSAAVASTMPAVPVADVQALVSENKKLQTELAAGGRSANPESGAMQSEIASLRAQNQVLASEVNQRLSAAPDRAAMDNAAAAANYKMKEAQNIAQASASADIQKAQTRFNAAESENIRLAKELAAARNQIAQVQAAPVQAAPVMQAAPVIAAAVPGVRASHISRPINDYDTVPASQPMAPMVVTATVAQAPAMMPVTPTQVAYAPAVNVGPSGSDIAQYLRRAGIPMVSGFEKVSKVSGPQFGAFRWDTGTVFGTAEQAIMQSPGGFEQAVNAYLAKTRQRCTGTFDESFDAGQFAHNKDFAVADVACVMPDGTGAGAAMVFYYKDGTFNVIAHEGDITQFDQAMSTRDSLARFMEGVI